MIDYLKEICISFHFINSKLYNLQYFCSEIHYLAGSGTPGLSEIVTKKPFECSRVKTVTVKVVQTFDLIH